MKYKNVSSDAYKMIDRINKKIRQFEKAGVENTALSILHQNLNSFYEREGINRRAKKASHTLMSKSKKLTDKQLSEMLDIGKRFENTGTDKLSYYTKTKSRTKGMSRFDVFKSNHPDMSLQDYIDVMENRETKLGDMWNDLMGKMSSDQILETYSMIQSKGLSTRESNILLDKAIHQYDRYVSKTGDEVTASDKLYNTIFDELNNRSTFELDEWGEWSNDSWF